MRMQASRQAGSQVSQSFISIVGATRFAVRIGRCCAGIRTKHITSQMQKPNPIYKSHASLAIRMPDPGEGATVRTRCPLHGPAPSIDAGALLCSALLRFAPSPYTPQLR